MGPETGNWGTADEIWTSTLKLCETQWEIFSEKFYNIQESLSW